MILKQYGTGFEETIDQWDSIECRNRPDTYKNNSIC